MRYIIDSEVFEEITEILLFNNFEKEDEVIICCPKYIACKLPQSYKVYSYDRAHRYFLNKIIQLFLLFFLVVKHRPDILFSGYPLLKHRVINILSFNRVKHYSYLRGLFADSRNYRGFSDKLFLLISKLNFFYKINNFQCDKIFTISKLNVDFLLARGVRFEVIQLISPPWLKRIEIERSVLKASDAPKGIIYFVSQAFDAHSCNEAAKSQVDFACQLKQELEASGYHLIVRKHPRDYTNYEILGLEFNAATSYNFIESLSKNDILISPFSTLAFEVAYFNIKVIFYSTRELDGLYSGVYKKMAIRPLYNPQEVISKIIETETSSSDERPFSNVFFK